jgi:hypothetical protein
MVKDTGDRFYYYVDDSLSGISMSDRAFYNYPNQPEIPPRFVYSDDNEVVSNNLKGVVFQFAYRYIYADGRTSLYSPYSAVASPPSGEGLYGEELDSAQKSNKLTLYLEFPPNRSEITAIDVVFRSGLGSGWGVWTLLDRVAGENILLDGSLEVGFYNDRAFQVVDQSEVLSPYNSLPLIADSQTSLMNNRIGYGGITEGFDPVLPDITLTPELSSSEPTETGEAVVSNITIRSGREWTTVRFLSVVALDYRDIVITSLPDVGNIIQVRIDHDIKLSHKIVSGSTIGDVKEAIVKKIRSVGYSGVRSISGGIRFMKQRWHPPKPYNQYEVLEATIYSAPSVINFKIPGFKTGASHSVCLFYYDSLMRRSDPIASNSTKFYIPFITESSIEDGGMVNKYNVDWEINHQPPSWAKYWRWGYTGNTSIGYFVQYSISSVIDPVEEDYENTTLIEITPLQRINNVPQLSGYFNIFNTNIPPYEFVSGDRVRLIMPKTADSPDEDDIQHPYDEYYDYEIIDYITKEDGTPAELKHYILINEIDYDEIDFGTGSVVEIYRPKRQVVDTEFREFGPVYSVITGDDGLLYHMGDDGNDQDADNPAMGTLSGGDVYHILRQFSFGITGDTKPLPVESYSPSDFYDSAVWGEGRPGFIFGIGRKHLNNIRHSDPLIQDTKINGLSTFQPLNYITVNRKHGEITAMREIGHTLKVLQESNNVSVGVGRTEYDDAAGSATSIASDKILGSQRISVSGYGCINPESVLSVGHNLYWFDALRGSMIRDAGGGAFPISGRFMTPEGGADYKMESYFQEKAKLVREGEYSVFTGYHEPTKLLFVFFKHRDPDGYYTYENDLYVALDGNPYTSFDTNEGDDMIVFHEPSNKWVTNVTLYDLDYIDSGGTSLVYFINDGIYIFAHPSAKDCVFDGIQYGCGTDVYSSEANFVDKIYNAICVHSNSKPRIESVEVWNEQVVGGVMKSKIFYKLIKKIKGVFRSAFMRDGLVGSAVSRTKLYTGNLLRGKVLKSSITFDAVLDGDKIKDGVDIYKVDYECESDDY